MIHSSLKANGPQVRWEGWPRTMPVGGTPRLSLEEGGRCGIRSVCHITRPKRSSPPTERASERRARVRAYLLLWDLKHRFVNTAGKERGGQVAQVHHLLRIVLVFPEDHLLFLLLVAAAEVRLAVIPRLEAVSEHLLCG